MNTSRALPDIRKLVLINAPIENVWHYISSSEGLSSWWLPNTFQPVPGEEFILLADFGDSMCKVTEFDPPKGRHARAGFSWGSDWHVSFRLIRFTSITEFRLIHSGWDADKMDAYGQPHDVIRKKMDSEWEMCVLKQLPKAVLEHRRSQ